MSKPFVIHWFRRDLRLADNPSLNAAVERAREIDGQLLCLFILDDDTAGEWAWGGAHRWWLDKSLKNLSETLSERGNALVLRRGKADEVLKDILSAHDIQGVYWNRCYEPFTIKRDKAIKSELEDEGITVESFNGSLLNEPWTIETKTGGPYKVFTPYWRAMLGKGGIHKPSEAHKSLPSPTGLNGDALEDWGLHPTDPDWSGGLAKRWTPGEQYARDRLSYFLDKKVAHYHDKRDIPGTQGTSRMSPYLHWGEISPRQIWHMAVDAHGHPSKTDVTEPYLREIGWREFSYHLLYHFPDLPTDPLNEKFEEFPLARRCR